MNMKIHINFITYVMKILLIV